ncbi:hypothetical protein BYT27DRAFT_7258073 [Phlegmacium glaucopus]|nr:hypothetical protein BYT27DRAFT_7258073 [Phlegmacium glaucopus]
MTTFYILAMLILSSLFLLSSALQNLSDIHLRQQSQSSPFKLVQQTCSVLYAVTLPGLPPSHLTWLNLRPNDSGTEITEISSLSAFTGLDFGTKVTIHGICVPPAAPTPTSLTIHGIRVPSAAPAPTSLTIHEICVPPAAPTPTSVTIHGMYVPPAAPVLNAHTTTTLTICGIYVLPTAPALNAQSRTSVIYIPLTAPALNAQSRTSVTLHGIYVPPATPVLNTTVSGTPFFSFLTALDVWINYAMSIPWDSVETSTWEVHLDGPALTHVQNAEKACFQVIKDLDHVAGRMHGSITSKKYMRNEIWSLINYIGAPSWYITLSPADIQHPICIYFADTKKEFKLNFLPYDQRVRLVCQNPVAGACFFHFIVESFIADVLGVDANHRGLYGETEAHYGTVEQQGRLTLHLHMLIWI